MRVIVQARLGSTRLPGKILAPLAGKPLLWHVVRRLEMAAAWTNAPWEVVIATTNLAQDALTCQWCASEGIRVLRGPAEDVLARYLVATADLSDDDTILRATADNPVYCPRRTAAIAALHARADVDYTCIRGISYAAPEVIRVGALRKMATKALDPYCREHVTPYFRQPPHGFRTRELPPTYEGIRPDDKLTIDTPADLTRLERLFDTCSRRGLHFSLEEAYRYLDQHEAKCVPLAA